VRIRPANPSDIPSMMNLERENPSAAHWSRQQYDDLFHENSTSLEHFAWVLEDDGGCGCKSENIVPGSPKTIAFLVARRVDVDWELENIVVAATVRRRGLGRLLLRHFISHAQAAAGNSIFLEVRRSNRTARAFYQTSGFVETGSRKNYYPSNDFMTAEDAVLYRLSIA
jgi:[ribosomal protein S18]-alanine N-acetyltransferase